MAEINHIEKDAKLVGYILAGGESRRFNYEIKGLAPLGGKAMIEHVIERFKPQVDYLNINSHFIEYSQFGFPTLGETNNFLGPLSGLFHCMQHMHDYYPSAEWLVLTPCDAPFMPKNMTKRLMQNNSYRAQCFSYEGELQPTFSIWHKDLLDDLRAAFKMHQWGGLKIFLEHLGDAVNVVEYPQQTINPFFNINSEKDRIEAEKILKKN